MITGIGASGNSMSDFLTVAESRTPDGSPKYAKTVIVWLAKVIGGRGGGINKDTPLFELCHLVHSINCLHEKENITNGRLAFFLGIENTNPARYRDWFLSHQTKRGGIGNHIVADQMGIAIEYPDERFCIRYGRIPKLVALHEFLCSMDQFANYENFNQLFNTLFVENGGQCEINIKQIQNASNSLSSYLRKYRRANLPRAQYDEKFAKLFNFLQERAAKNEKEQNAPSRSFTIDDETILEFWVKHSFLEDFRIYKGVFDNFTVLIDALETVEVEKSIDQAAVIGTDIDNFEVEPDDEVASITDYAEWQSPLIIFDEEPVKRVKFFKHKSEHQPIEQLMYYGPYANRLPLAFLRLETFGRVQAGISNDLRLKRSRDELLARISCSDAETYTEKQEVLRKILEHIKQLQLAALYALQKNNQQEIPNGNNVFRLFDDPIESDFNVARSKGFSNEFDEESFSAVIKDAEEAFQSLTRQGFTEAQLDNEDHLEAFRVAAGALTEAGAHLQNFLNSISKDTTHATPLEEQFKIDQKAFSNQFQEIYGVSP